LMMKDANITLLARGAFRSNIFCCCCT
jgi:hypothetical protein